MKTKTALFTMRLSFSGRAAHRASLSQGQEAFLESHVYVSFWLLGCVAFAPLVLLGSLQRRARFLC